MLAIYLKPFKKGLSKKILKRFLDKKFKRNLARAGLKSIKEMQKKTSRKGVRIRKGIHFTIGQKSITFHLNSIGYYHNYGVRRHKMKYLQKATRPIPIKTRTGELIFRWASKKSMKKRDSWIHPGLKPKNFLKKGIEELKKDFRKRIKNDIQKYLKKGS